MAWWQWLPVLFVVAGAAEIAGERRGGEARGDGVGRAGLVAAMFLGTVIAVNHVAHEAGFALGAQCALHQLSWDACH